jgi:putative flippase GtrA
MAMADAGLATERNITMEATPEVMVRHAPTARLVKFMRYAGVSIIATVIAQAGLAVAYGWLRWPVAAAVAFSLAVSAVPAYILARRYVWTGQGRGGSRQVGSFLGLAGLGSLATIVVVWLAVQVAHGSTSDHGTLTMVANSASIVSTGLIWLGRYVVLDHFVFTPAP